jgi:hypothetical protein
MDGERRNGPSKREEGYWVVQCCDVMRVRKWMKGLLKCEVLVGYLEWSVRLRELQGCWKACVSAPARFEDRKLFYLFPV